MVDDCSQLGEVGGSELKFDLAVTVRRGAIRTCFHVAIIDDGYFPTRTTDRYGARAPLALVIALVVFTFFTPVANAHEFTARDFANHKIVSSP